MKSVREEKQIVLKRKKGKNEKDKKSNATLIEKFYYKDI